MANGIHKVVLYTRGTDFHVTARKPSARLAEVNDWASREGYSVKVLKAGLDKPDAEMERDNVKGAYARKGYVYQTFPQL